jgi:PAS domain S-box-containing protein
VATIEHRVLMPSGEVRWQQWTDRAIFDQEGHIVEFQSVGRDITAHKRAEKELHQKNELLKLLQVITTAANSASTLEVTMQTALDEVCVYTGSPVGHVYLTDSTGELIPTAIWHLENPERFGTLRKVTEATRFAPGVGLPGRILASRNPAWITDVTDDPNFLRAKQTKDIGVRTSFGFPVLIGTEVVAVLEFFSPEVIEPDNSLLEVITQISTQLGRVFERKRAEEEIQQVKERTESVLESMADTHILFDRHWRYLYVNQAAVRAIGRQREQILGRTLWELYPDIVGTELEPQYHRAMDERLPVAFDFHYPPLDTWWENRFYPAPEGLAVFATNITERKLAEKALMETLDHLSKKNRYETIISTVTRNVHQSINLQDVLENAVEAMNKNIDRVDKVSIYLVEGEDAVLMAHRGYTDQYIKRAGRISYPRGTTWKTIIEGKPRYVADADRDAVIGPAGREMGTKSYASMPIHFEGKTVGVININSLQKNAFDEEELKLLKIIAQQIEIAINNAQQAEMLRESEERFRRIFEEGPLGMAVTGWDYRFIQVNTKLCQMLGHTEQELLGLTFTEVTHPEDISKDVQLVQQIFRGEIPYYRVEKRYIKKNKEIIWCNLTSAGIHDMDGKCPYSLKMIEDITEHKRAEEALQEYAERLQSLSHKLLEVQETERRNIARELHDEVGQVLTAVKINLQKIGRSNKNRTLAPHLEESIAIIDNAIEQVRNLSLDLRPSMLDDLGLIATLRWYIDRQAQQAGFVAELVTDLRAHLHPDLETVCFRIVQEALTNVVRHAQAQRVYISLRQRNGELELVIRDNGVGFDARVAQKRAAHGASFGLLGMQERTQLVSGQIKIRSEPKRGTTIRARFPLIPSLSLIKRR